MKSQREATVQKNGPMGNLCVLRDESLSAWTVQICPGAMGKRTALAKFSTRGEAEIFAKAELEKMNSGGGDKVYVLHVDDCPCWQKQL